MQSNIMDHVCDFLGARRRPRDGSKLQHSPCFISIMVHLNVFIYSFAFWSQQPNLQKIFNGVKDSDSITSTEQGALNSGSGSSNNNSGSSSLYSLYQSLTATSQLIGGPLMGIICDKLGPVISVCICQLASSLIYLTYATATSSNAMFLTLIPASFQHVFLSSQAAISLLSEPNKRSVAMGRLVISYSLGMIIGSPFGGYLSSIFNTSVTSLSASFICCLMILINYIWIPFSIADLGSSEHETPSDTDMDINSKGKSNPEKNNENKNKGDDAKKDNKGNAVMNLVAILIQPRILLVILPSTVVGITIQTYRSMIPAWFDSELKLGSKELGLFFSFVAVNSFIANVFVVGWLNNLISNDINIMIFIYFSLGIAFLGLTQIHSFESLLLLSIPSSILSSVLLTTTSSYLSRSVPVENAGSAISLSHASRSLTGIVAPLIAFSLNGIGIEKICIAAATTSTISATILLIRSQYTSSKPHIHQD